MLELGFEGKRSSSVENWEKGLPDRVNTGKAWRLKLWKWGRAGRAPCVAGTEDKVPVWRKQAGLRGPPGASSARVLNCADQPGA